MQHLSYELCLELKTAGFPQGYWEGWDDHGGGKWIDVDNSIFDHETGFPLLYEPTLEELIWECGMAFNSLERDRNESWIADAEAGYTYHQMWIGEGITPKEAVARLWLQIHGK